MTYTITIPSKIDTTCEVYDMTNEQIQREVLGVFNKEDYPEIEQVIYDEADMRKYVNGNIQSFEDYKELLNRTLAKAKQDNILERIKIMNARSR